MSFVKSIFTLGLINFVLTIGVLSAAQVISGQSETLASPSPTTISPVLTTIPTPTPTVQVIIKKIIRPKVAMKNTVAASPSPTQAPVPTQDPLAGKCLI
ncbi:MAG TPA: hypothetical protein VF810_00050, partial [Patescibacteria group bacterium]